MNTQAQPNQSKNNRILFLVFLIIILVGYLLFANTKYFRSPTEPALNPELKITDEQLQKALEKAGLTAKDLAKANDTQVVNVVKQVSPAVVSIIASAEVPVYEQYYRDQPFFNDPFFEEFFGDSFGFQIPDYRQKGTEKQKIGAGTGFIVSPDGYIITNKHVVENENAEYTVILNHGEEKDGTSTDLSPEVPTKGEALAKVDEKVVAEVLARDPIKDIAVLKIDKVDLPYVEMGDSDKLRVGQTAIAIGYALGEFDNTVSKGVVSGLSRSIMASTGFGQSEELEGIIQTDAAVNPGNSGGPLLNIDGQVIGVNVAIAQGSENIGFALPINDIKRTYETVKQTGKIEYPYLGIRYLPITEEIQKENNLPYDYGALVIRGENPTDLPVVSDPSRAESREVEPAVIPGSAADLAGITENDIILELNGAKINQENPLNKLILKHKVGDTVTLKIYHKGKEQTVKVTLQARK